MRALPLANQGVLLAMHRAEVRGYEERFAAGCLVMRPVIADYGLSVEAGGECRNLYQGIIPDNLHGFLMGRAMMRRCVQELCFSHIFIRSAKVLTPIFSMARRR
jgi:hypothetical protein